MISSNIVLIIVAFAVATAAIYALYSIILFQGVSSKGDDLQLTTKNILDQVDVLYSKKEYALDARIKGGERHMIMSGEYDKVFPMDIYPEYLIKAIITGDIDRMEALGIYEVAPEDFALCEFVDSSKLEVQRIVRQGLDMLRKELC